MTKEEKEKQEKYIVQLFRQTYGKSPVGHELLEFANWYREKKSLSKLEKI